MKILIKKISTMALFAFVMSSSVHGDDSVDVLVTLPRQGGPYFVYQQKCSNWGVIQQEYTKFGNTKHKKNTMCETWATSSPVVATNGTYQINTTPDSYNDFGDLVKYSRSPNVYFLALADGVQIPGTARFGTEFVGKSTWTFSKDGATNTIS